MSDFKPSGNAEPPLAKATAWVETACPACGGTGRRETNTMPQWAGSCWYYLRYIDPRNQTAIVDPALERYWMNVDLYVGGAEHAVLHLLYARFWHKVLYDLGVVSTDEPFRRLVNQGIILGEDGQKMSKSRGNVVNPDTVIEEVGADSLRLFEMFMGPLEQSKAWSTKGVLGLHRFLGRVWRLVVSEDGSLRTDLVDREMNETELRLIHMLADRVTRDLDRMAFNTALSGFMIFLNEAAKLPEKPRGMLEWMVRLLSPFAPHIAEELWERLGQSGFVAHAAWPEADPRWTRSEEIEVAVQVQGRIRARIRVPAEADAAEVERLALSREEIVSELAGRTPRRVIVVPGRLVNIVV
ncbi:MAG: class I tRNA ligase family protein [Candidatus Omnitrophica bacterium]|nr:class I tRNA ligase family protein [Candidatus Omnitrophota bacterium]